MEVESKTLTSLFQILHHLASIFPSSLLPPKSSAAASIIHLLRRFLILSLRLLLFLFFSPSRGAHAHAGPATSAASPNSSVSSAAERALSHLLSVVSGVPVASRKYGLVRSLADRLLDDNLRFDSSSSLNRNALSAAFDEAVRRLEIAVTSPPEGVISAVVAAVRRWGEIGVSGEEKKMAAAAGDWRPETEKMAAEVAWMAGKMAECGAVEEAVRRWGEAAGLGRVSLTAEPRIQGAFVRVSAFLFKHANAKQFVMKEGAEEGEDTECDVNSFVMAMLRSWLPLLCRASNGTDAPVLSTGERGEMVKVLEEMIEKLGWRQQEEVLALWLHHFTSCPDSDWPNLESCYIRWYSKSRELFLN